MVGRRSALAKRCQVVFKSACCELSSKTADGVASESAKSRMAASKCVTPTTREPTKAESGRAARLANELRERTR